MSSQNRSGKQRKPKGPRNGPVGGFDKIHAIRTVEVPVTTAGVYAFPDAVNSADRVWLEWLPSAALVGKARRCFVSKQGVADPSAILTDRGVQLARKGMSCSLEDRRAVVFGPGKFKIWVASERDMATQAASGSALPTQLLEYLSSGNTSSGNGARPSGSVARRPT
jgi:hypothetical protein